MRYSKLSHLDVPVVFDASVLTMVVTVHEDPFPALARQTGVHGDGTVSIMIHWERVASAPVMMAVGALHVRERQNTQDPIVQLGADTSCILADCVCLPTRTCKMPQTTDGVMHVISLKERGDVGRSSL